MVRKRIYFTAYRKGKKVKVYFEVHKKRPVSLRKDDKIFHDHIKAHLNPNCDVVCKICGKTYDEIVKEGYNDTK